ncbi:hypothetical protein [Candidatus Entotheonella palauensis]|uniref:Uncharacterized protein n=1 Tax=Candidatus Entotheonella gemina TaxID=1429439 RepID=W4M6I0_9BACT|nr:hypothetical protein [Candidatus Entotheonella palauensis]ETX05546.1 MAG: hypothetical protein ETSY2_22340 [Candidatus Entotheonella gemina]
MLVRGAAQPSHIRWRDVGAAVGFEPELEGGGLDAPDRGKGLCHRCLHFARGGACDVFDGSEFAVDSVGAVRGVPGQVRAPAGELSRVEGRVGALTQV